MSRRQLAAPVVATAMLLLAVAAEAQLGGTWNITGQLHQTDADGNVWDLPVWATVVVTQQGNQLSGTYLIPEEDVADCALTCDPATAGCAFKADLTGTVSGNTVDVTLNIQRSLSADCDICQLQQSYSEQLQAHGTLNGSSIRGSLSEQLTASCNATGDIPDICISMLDCINASGTGSVEVRIGGAPFPTPTPVLPHLPCPGDCGRDNIVTVDELLRGINIALGNESAASCSEFDVNKDGSVTVDELLRAVNAALNGCVFTPVPGCELGGTCGEPEECPFVSCGFGSAAVCIQGRCLVGTCACSSDIPSCCELTAATKVAAVTLAPNDLARGSRAR